MTDVLNSLHSSASHYYSALQSYRLAREVVAPGAIESLGFESRNVMLDGYAFEGAKADLVKVFSVQPLFHIQHSLALPPASAANPMMPAASSAGTYSFSTTYASQAGLFMAGTLDHAGQLMAKLICPVPKTGTTLKAQAQLNPAAPSQDMLLVEADHVSHDYSLNIKAYNPSPAGFVGVASLLTSISRSYSAGFESSFNTATMPSQGVLPSMTSLSLLGKYASLDKKSIFSARYAMGAGALQAAYWRKLSDKVEATTDLTVSPGQMGAPTEVIGTAAARYDFRMSTLRAQVDSTGKLGMLLEQRLGSFLSLLLSGSIDYVKNSSKFGVGIQLEFTPPEIEEQMRQQAAAAQAQAAPAI